MTASFFADIFAIIVKEFLWDLGSFTSPVNIIVADQNPVGLRIVKNIIIVLFTFLVAVMGILLMPVPGLILEVDIISIALLQTSLKIRPFAAEPWVIPVLTECHHFRNTHGVHEEVSTVLYLALTSAAGANYPVSYLCPFSYLRLTGCESAETIKGVWSESKILSNYV